LARLRDEYRLGQANIGEIDPASETMKLATLGLRGVAVNLLWEKANYYKKTEDWTNLTATLEQLAKLQPNFTTFWRFQAWNLSYNVSVEFDDYHDRYYYVRRGIQFLEKGERHNQDSPRLLWDLGWFIGQKIGRADEHEQYRRLFKNDDEFHPPDRLPDQRDNWLVGKEWYNKGVDAVKLKGMDLGKQSPRIFFSSPAMSQINYAAAIEKEGFFEKARRAWIRAGEEWDQFGDEVIEHSTGVLLRLGDQPRLEGVVAELRKRLDAMAPGLREKIAKEKLDALTMAERTLHEIPPAELTDDQLKQWEEIEEKLKVSDRDLAERIAHDEPARAKESLRLLNELEREDLRLYYTISYKRDSNYDYWATRCAFEQTPNAIAAREKMYNARKAFLDQNLPLAKQLYKDGFAKWRLVIDAFPSILDDEATTGDDLIEYLQKYREVLDQLDETLEDDFPLWEVIEKYDNDGKFTDELKAHQERKAANGNAPAGANDEANGTAPTGASSETAPETSNELRPGEGADNAADKSNVDAGNPLGTAPQ